MSNEIHTWAKQVCGLAGEKSKQVKIVCYLAITRQAEEQAGS